MTKKSTKCVKELADLEVDMEFISFGFNMEYPTIQDHCAYSRVHRGAENPFPLPLEDELGRSRDAWSIVGLASWSQTYMEGLIARAKQSLSATPDGVDISFLSNTIDELEQIGMGNRAILEKILGVDLDSV